MRPSRRALMRYRFDNFMAKGARSIFLSLVISFVAILAAIGLLRIGVLTSSTRQLSTTAGPSGTSTSRSCR